MAHIWQPVREALTPLADPVCVDWPRPLTAQADTLQDFAVWLRSAVPLDDFDGIIGHSMGGLVALLLAASGQTPRAKTVLVESFLVSPSPFFQNLFVNMETPPAQAVLEMLECEKPHYSPALRFALRDVDMTAQVRSLASPIHVVYGDRGCGQPQQVYNELHLPVDLASQVTVHIIPNTAHFPMVENPQATVERLTTIFFS